ncbi:aspartate--tRNA ligase [Candidatus Woesearchaeota archaeon]|nr:aspartate--tRNA ligase [Candidatus Woesearchaeota archaeon]
MLRTNTCGELTAKDIGRIVTLAGWCHSRRDHGGVIFIDLRDRYGLTQVVLDPSHSKKVHKLGEHIGREWVISAKGKVRNRPKDMVNPKMATGEIEVLVDELQIITKAAVPPIEVDDRVEASEDIRMKYKYLDLRRPMMQQRLIFRHKAAEAVREYFSKNSFIEIETPLLVRSTPEGARDYVVPSRVSPGKFYALPQSPQLYKQILMIAGFDKYFQLAKCLRDEDLRADRQPEHTQIDFEISFVDEKDVMLFVEGLYKHLFKEMLEIDLKTPFQVLTHAETMAKYGTDKPDLRFGMELTDVTEIVRKSDFKTFASEEQVKCVVAEKDFSRNEIDELIGWAKENGAKGLAWMKATDKGLESSIVKFFSTEIQKQLLLKTKAKKGSVLFFVADSKKKVAEVLGKLRVELGQRFGLIPKSAATDWAQSQQRLGNDKEFKFCWVVAFPLFEWNADVNRWEAAHHMFTSPKPEHADLLEKDPGKVLGNLYDLVLNGTELGSGSIRINSPDLQERVMKVVGLSHEAAQAKFGFLLEAYKFGAPVHGGMGIGFDRTVALMQGLHDIREVIAFPKNKKAESPMDGSPSEVEERQLKELHIKSDVVGK